MDVSFIIPLYNGKKFIDKIVSNVVQNQKVLKKQGWYKEIEIIFVNDAPWENISQNDVQKFKDTIIITVITNRSNLGIHQTRIKGLDRAKGEYVVFLDQDDEIFDDYLLSQFVHIGNSDAVLCNGMYRNNKRIYSDENQQKEAVTKNIYFKQEVVIVSPGQVMLRRDIIPNEWKYNYLKKNGSDDVLLWLLMMRDNRVFTINSFVKYVHVENGSNTSMNFISMKESVQELIYLIKKKNFMMEEDLSIIEDAIKRRIEKYNAYIEVLDKWEKIIENIVLLINGGKNISVAIYGYGVLGEKLLIDLKKENIDISCMIDKDASSYDIANYKIYAPIDVQHNINLIILTPIFAEESIRRNLKNWDCPIVSLKQLCQ